MKKLQLYIWDGFAPDYSGGLAFAIAESEEKAKELVEAAYSYSPSDWGTLSVHPINKPIAFAVSGGA